jgi:transcriptional regulator with XRE-family HTH domain
MDTGKRKALEAAGWRFGDAADFLEMSDEERQLLETRVEAALAVRRQRQARKLSQKQLAGLIKTSQPRIAKIEQAAPDVSLDQILRAFAAAGGRVSVKQVQRSTRNKRAGRPKLGRKARVQTDAGDMQIELIRTKA